MTREERDLDGVLVPGSDHLTAYNLYAEAFREAGYIGEVYGLPRHLFHPDKMERWAERRGVLVKAVEDAALAMASVYRSVGLSLPSRMPFAGDRVHRRFADLLARFMPFDLVIDERDVRGAKRRASRRRACAGADGAIAGSLRYFADRYGTTHAAIEGTQVPLELLSRYARRGESRLVYDPARQSLVLAWKHGALRLRAGPGGPGAARVGAGAGRAGPAGRLPRSWRAGRHGTRRCTATSGRSKRCARLWRRSGGRTAKLELPELTALYEAQLEGVRTMDEFLERPLELDLEGMVPRETREKLLALPGTVFIRDRDVELGYDVEQDEKGAPVGVVRLQLPEKLARTLVEEELPVLDRPMRFMVSRGRRGNASAGTLLELQDLLDQPWMPEELERPRDDRRGGGRPVVRHGPRTQGSAPRRPGTQGRGKPASGGGRGGGGRRGTTGGGRSHGGKPGHAGRTGRGGKTRGPKR